MRTKLFIVLLALFSLQAKAWDWWPLPMAEPDTCHEQLLYVSEVGVLASGGKGTPTWLQANRNGAVSPMPFSGSVTWEWSSRLHVTIGGLITMAELF